MKNSFMNIRVLCKSFFKTKYNINNNNNNNMKKDGGMRWKNNETSLLLLCFCLVFINETEI